MCTSQKPTVSCNVSKSSVAWKNCVLFMQISSFNYQTFKMDGMKVDFTKCFICITTMKNWPKCKLYWTATDFNNQHRFFFPRAHFPRSYWTKSRRQLAHNNCFVKSQNIVFDSWLLFFDVEVKPVGILKIEVRSLKNGSNPQNLKTNHS